MYYHVRISQKSNKARGEVKLDLTDEQLRLRFLDPYEQGQPIIINGKTIQMSDLERIRISRSNEDSKYLIHQVELERSQSSVVVLGGPSDEWKAAGKAEDVTDDFILGPPGYKSFQNRTEQDDSAGVGVQVSNNKVFIVHGHDHALKNDLEVFVREVGLEPIVLHRQADEGLTIIEKFERHSDVKFAFVLLTPDDVGLTADQLSLPEDKRSYEFRARQNVVFEFGYFAANLGRSNVCCIFKEGVVVPSDVSGLLYKKVSTSIEEIGYSLIKELKNAGLELEV